MQKPAVWAGFCTNGIDGTLSPASRRRKSGQAEAACSQGSRLVGALSSPVIGVGLAPPAAHATVPAELRRGPSVTGHAADGRTLTPSTAARARAARPLVRSGLRVHAAQSGHLPVRVPPRGTPSVQPPVVIFSATVAEGGDYIARRARPDRQPQDDARERRQLGARRRFGERPSGPGRQHDTRGPGAGGERSAARRQGRFGTVTGYATVPAGTWTIDLITRRARPHETDPATRLGQRELARRAHGSKRPDDVGAHRRRGHGDPGAGGRPGRCSRGRGRDAGHARRRHPDRRRLHRLGLRRPGLGGNRSCRDARVGVRSCSACRSCGTGAPRPPRATLDRDGASPGWEPSPWRPSSPR